MFYPRFPSENQMIGICAPSAGIGYKSDSFDLSEESICSMGFTIRETASVRSDDNPSASAEIRGSEFNALFADPDVKAVCAATGGEYNIEMLPYIDEKLLLDNPKWFAGYSDPTNISYYMTTKLDIATIYGFNAGSFDWRPLHEYQQNALRILSGDVFTQHSFDMWDSGRDFENICMDAEVRWDLHLPSGLCKDACEFTGRLIGGCSDVINALVGTPYEDTISFVERYEDDGFLWYFDTFEMSPFDLYLFLIKMKLAGYFYNAKVVILGRVMLPHGATDEEYIELAKRALSDIPFVWGADIGHTKPAMTLINGAIGKLKLHNGEAELEMFLK